MIVKRENEEEEERHNFNNFNNNNNDERKERILHYYLNENENLNAPVDLRAVCFVRAIVFYVRDFCAERTNEEKKFEKEEIFLN